MRPRQQSCRWNFMPPKIHRALECSALESLEIVLPYQHISTMPSKAVHRNCELSYGFVWLCDHADSVHLHAISQDLNSERTWTKDRIRIERSAKEPAKWPQVTPSDQVVFASKYLVIHEIMKFAPNISKICTVSSQWMSVSPLSNVTSCSTRLCCTSLGSRISQDWLESSPAWELMMELGKMCLELRSWQT